VLLVNGESQRTSGNRDEARTQFDLARQVDPNSLTGWHAALRLARTNFDLREFTQATADVAPVVAAAAPPDVRAAALLLQAEAAYHGGDRAAAAAAFRRFLVEFPGHAEAPSARLGVAWSALRLGQADDARREFLEFARADAQHASTPDALELAAELAIAAGDLDSARQLLDQVVNTYATHPRADFARLNRGILMVRTGQFAEAQSILRDWLGRASFPPLFGRAQAALGTAFLATGGYPQAAREFRLAQKEGVGGFASLGLGAVALAQHQWDEAQQRFAEARDAGTASETRAAEYGLAAAAFHRGAVADFKPIARRLVDAGGTGPSTAPLLYVLTGIAAGEKDWPAALDNARRLVTQFPSHDTADDALERVGAAASAAQAWPVVYEAYTLLAQRYPQSPFVDGSRLALAEAQVATGRNDEARQLLERFVAASPSDSRTPRAWLMLARLREGAGDRAGALDAYGRVPPDGAGWAVDAQLSHARLLAQDRQWAKARPILERVLRGADGDVAAQAATGIGDAYRGEGDPLNAAEYYMTAAYMAPQSAAGRAGLLGAARSLSALKQGPAAASVYRKLLAQTDLPADVAATARQELAPLAR
jgi:tetratricopeptide (TPR) repeat protein